MNATSPPARLRAFIDREGLKVGRVASRIGVSRGWLHRVLRGEELPSEAHQGGIEVYMRAVDGVDPITPRDWRLFGEADATPPTPDQASVGQ